MIFTRKKKILKKVDSEGITLIYEPKSNTFGAYNNNGIIRTFFKPDPAKHPYGTNMEYWEAQEPKGGGL